MKHDPQRLVTANMLGFALLTASLQKDLMADLAGIWVYKFRFNRQEYLVAYRPPPSELLRQVADIELLFVDFYQVSSHENFYDELKRYLKSEE